MTLSFCKGDILQPPSN